MSISGLAYSKYHGYLRSDKWRQTKNRYWTSKSPKVCYGCGARSEKDKRLDLHHRSYRKLWGKEALTDLIPLCRPCHDEVHVFIKKGLERGAGLEGLLNRSAYYVRKRHKQKRYWEDVWDQRGGALKR